MANIYTEHTSVLATESAIYDVKPTISAPSATGFAERGLSRRFRAEPLNQKPVEYEFTRDPGLLHQYYLLREQMFINVWGLHHFVGREDQFDKLAHILIAKLGNLCIGGARILVKFPNASQRLPLENDDFNLEQLLPELNLREKRYGEFSRLALLPEFRGGKYTRQMYRHLNSKALECKLDYVFALAPLSQARSYRSSYRAMGFDYVIREDLAVPDREEFEGIRMCLSMLNLTPFYTGQHNPALYEELETI